MNIDFIDYSAGMSGTKRSFVPLISCLDITSSRTESNLGDYIIKCIS